MFASTIVSMTMLVIVGLILYNRFYVIGKQSYIESTNSLVKQTGVNLEDYLYSMREVSDSIYYDVIKDKDLDKENIENDMNLLYEANSSKIVSCALYDSKGQLIMASPNSKEKINIDVESQNWYKEALRETENLHFSTPHIQNLFDDSTNHFKWVISLSRAVEITRGGEPEIGVLLIDIDYSFIDSMVKSVNKSKNGPYIYLCDSKGSFISHPKQIQIEEGFSDENNKAISSLSTGVYKEKFKGENRDLVIYTVSYTGWKMVGVIPNRSFKDGMMNIKLFILMILSLTAFTVLLINRIVSRRISSPILKLDESVKAYEHGRDSKIYIGGSDEIKHLGKSIEKNYEKIELLIKDIKREQDERRKSELEALQSQINPHFLYNTLDSITWMIEGGKNDEAVFMIQCLARLFRISLSKGKTIISIKDEIQHAKSYMNIQKVRYQDAFEMVYEIDEKVLDKCIVKLVMQPILENAIYYGVNAEEEDGIITLRAYEKEGDIYIEIEDNGYGMPESEVEEVLKNENHVPKHGSGVGILNVHNRLKLLFGEEYGLSIKSELDYGTKVTIHIPSILFTEENRKYLEKGDSYERQ
ncbi:MAG: sensor histidine kinase [Lachnospiraceae bacterium]|nr:sensor histidine kinase [Lachnospiraceae bacterium]